MPSCQRSPPRAWRRNTDKSVWQANQLSESGTRLEVWDTIHRPSDDEDWLRMLTTVLSEHKMRDLGTALHRRAESRRLLNTIHQPVISFGTGWVHVILVSRFEKTLRMHGHNVLW